MDGKIVCCEGRVGGGEGEKRGGWEGGRRGGWEEGLGS